MANTEADDWMAFARVHIGDVERARNDWSYPNVDGIWTQDLGTRGQPIVWDLEVVFKDLATVNAWEQSLRDAAAEAKTYQMTAHGQTFDAVELREIRRLECHALAGPWMGRIHYQLLFLNHGS